MMHQRKHPRSADLSIQLILETDHSELNSLQAVCCLTEPWEFPECKINF